MKKVPWFFKNIAMLVVIGMSLFVVGCFLNNEEQEEPTITLSPVDAQTVEVNKELKFLVSAQQTGGGTVAFSLVDALPGTKIGSLTGEFTWTPVAGQVGTHSVKISASNGKISDTITVSVVVKDVQKITLNEKEGVRLEYPTGGESFSAGQTITVKWLMDVDIMDEAVVSFSNDNGVTYENFTPTREEWFKFPRDTVASGVKKVEIVNAESNIVRCSYTMTFKDTSVMGTEFKFDGSIVVKIWDVYPNIEKCENCLDGSTASFTVAAAPVSTFKLDVATVQEVTSFFGTNKVKLVFNLKDSGLCFVDYSTVASGTPRVKKLSGAKDGTFPVISPDGNYVTYATGTTEEYSSTPSTAWIQPLSASSTPVKVADGAHVPRFIQNADKPTVLYATCAKNSATGKYTFEGCGKMMKAEFNGGSVGAPVEIYGGGTFLGGLSYDNNYFAHGEQNVYAFMYSLKDPGNGVKILHCFGDGVSPQVCNTSVSSSKLYPNTMLYFDFGLQTPPNGLAGWGLHKKLFIGRYDGSIAKSIDLPPIPTPFSDSRVDEQIGDIEFSYPEYSNHPYFVTSSILTKRKYKSGTKFSTYSFHEMVYAFDVKQDKNQKIVWSTDTTRTTTVSMTYPWLWVERPANFTEESGWLEGNFYTPASECKLR